MKVNAPLLLFVAGWLFALHHHHHHRHRRCRLDDGVSPGGKKRKADDGDDDDKKKPKQSPAQKQLARVDASKMKPLTSFFAKKERDKPEPT